MLKYRINKVEGYSSIMVLQTAN